MPVKVCGLTRGEDARLAWDLGAAALGFVFHPASPRAMTALQVAHIRRDLPEGAICVGVFVDWEPERINDAAAEAGLAAVQLHGRETPETCAAVRLPVLKAIRAEESGDQDRLAAFQAAALLLDASHPERLGGTGRTADWTLARRLATRFRLVLAGGLGPGNAQAAWEAVRPAGLDLSSGVELAPGRKDPAKLRALFHALDPKGDRPCLF